MDTATTFPLPDPLAAFLDRAGWHWTCIAIGERVMALIQRGDVEGGTGWGDSPEAVLTAALHVATLRAVVPRPKLVLDPTLTPLCA
jgi:hypothetical protein